MTSLEHSVTQPEKAKSFFPFDFFFLKKKEFSHGLAQGFFLLPNATKEISLQLAGRSFHGRPRQCARKECRFARSAYMAVPLALRQHKTHILNGSISDERT